MSTSSETRDRTAHLRSDELATVAQGAAVPMAITLVVMTVLSVAAGLLITGPLAGSVDRWDLKVVEDLAADRTTALDRFTGLGGFLADTVPVAVLWVGAMAVGARLSGRWVVPAFLFFVIGGEKLTYLITSIVVGRPRPPVEALGHAYATGSFPSGHVASAVTLYGSIAVAAWWFRSRRARSVPSWSVVASAVAVVAIALWVAFSRTYRAHHYPSDVIAGAVLGVVWLVAGWRLVLRSDRPGTGMPSRTDEDAERSGDGFW